MNTKIIEPKLAEYSFEPTKTPVGIGDTIQDTSVSAQKIANELARLVVNSDPTSVSVADPDKDKALLEIIHYRPTMFGENTKAQVIQALQDFYNKVTGSALQSTSISYADLGAFIWLSKEYRALIKDIDRALWIYNQTSVLNPVYGKKLIDSIYGTGVYAKLSGGADAINRMRNELAKKINVQLPLMQGLRWTAVDDLCLDNIYSDDPDAKGMLIAFAREGYTVRLAPNGALVGLEAYDMWADLVASDIATFTEHVLDEFTNLISSVWFTDVRPYIENLQRKGGFREDAGIAESYMDKVANREFAPVYSPDVIDMIRNANIFPRKKYVVNSIGTRIEEDSAGYLTDMIAGKPVIAETDHTNVLFCMNRIKNFETYPAADKSIKKSLAFDFVPAKVASNTDDTKLLYASGAVITHITVHYGKAAAIGTAYGTIELFSNVVGLFSSNTDTAPSFVTDTYALNVMYLDEFRIIESINAMIKLNVFTWNAVNLALTQNNFVTAITNHSSVRLEPIIHDVDNIVVLDDVFYTNYYRILSYEQVYNSEAITAVAGK